MGKKTTIQISPELHCFLTAQAVKKDETYDDILKRLLKKLWGAEFNKPAEKEG